MEPVTIGPCTLFCADCRDVLPLLEGVDVVVTDPPYGVNLDANYHGRGMSRLCQSGEYPPIEGDDEPFDPSHLLDFPTVVLFGANYYASKLPDMGQWLVWDKRDGVCSVDQADAELAWVKGGNGTVPRVFRHLWMGAIRDSERDSHRCHPTQKPIALMAWALDRIGITSDATVCDPYMGSGTTGIACVRSGRTFIGIEKSPAYFDIACRRIRDAVNAEKSSLFPAGADL